MQSHPQPSNLTLANSTWSQPSTGASPVGHSFASSTWSQPSIGVSLVGHSFPSSAWSQPSSGVSPVGHSFASSAWSQAATGGSPVLDAWSQPDGYTPWWNPSEDLLIEGNVYVRSLSTVFKNDFKLYINTYISKLCLRSC